MIRYMALNVLYLIVYVEFYILDLTIIISICIFWYIARYWYEMYHYKEIESL